MAQPRSQLVPSDIACTLHCVQRCVRRAFLCGIDDYTGQSFEHRKHWVQDRIALVASCFSADVFAYAVMSNHLHIVVHMDPTHVGTWDDETVVERWLTLFPPRKDSHDAREHKRLRILQDLPYLTELRRRLGDLSWLMRCLAEPIARRANAEDRCKGRFWEGRYKCQLLCDTRAVLAAMTYVDLNPIRAGMTTRLGDSDHTSVQQFVGRNRRRRFRRSDASVPAKRHRSHDSTTVESASRVPPYEYVLRPWPVLYRLDIRSQSQQRSKKSGWQSGEVHVQPTALKIARECAATDARTQ